MEDWEDESVPINFKKEQPKSEWDDEDVDDNDTRIKESWEDEEKLSPAPKKPVAKGNVKEGNPVEASIAVQKGSVVENLDPQAEKPPQQTLVEEAEYKSTAQLLLGKTDDENTIDNFIPKAESDFSEYAQLISHKLRPYEGGDAKEIASSVTAIASEKIKAEKEAAVAKKKTAAKKKQLHLEKDEDVVNAEYDDFDYYNVA